MLPTPSVEFTASTTPPIGDSQSQDSRLFASQQELSQFQDADDDPIPLTGSWADLVEQEERALMAAAAVPTTASATTATAVSVTMATTTVDYWVGSQASEGLVPNGRHKNNASEKVKITINCINTML